MQMEQALEVFRARARQRGIGSLDPDILLLTGGSLSRMSLAADQMQQRILSEYADTPSLLNPEPPVTSDSYSDEPYQSTPASAGPYAAQYPEVLYDRLGTSSAPAGPGQAYGQPLTPARRQGAIPPASLNYRSAPTAPRLSNDRYQSAAAGDAPYPGGSSRPQPGPGSPRSEPFAQRGSAPAPQNINRGFTNRPAVGPGPGTALNSPYNAPPARAASQQDTSRLRSPPQPNGTPGVGTSQQAASSPSSAPPAPVSLGPPSSSSSGGSSRSRSRNIPYGSSAAAQREASDRAEHATEPSAAEQAYSRT